jgi:GT2 family glycosyltransferase
LGRERRRLPPQHQDIILKLARLMGADCKELGTLEDHKSIASRFERGLIWMKWLLARVLRSFLFRSRRLLAHSALAPQRYRLWIKRYDVITPALRDKMASEIGSWPSQPLISVIMPSYNIDPKWIGQAIESIRRQIYPHWELCISDDASTLAGIRPLLERYAAEDSRILVTFRSENGHISVNSNTALALANGDYIALMDTDDLLSEDALFWVAREIAIHPDVDLLFSDEDKIDGNGKRFNPYFKSAWNPALMLSQNAFSHLGVFRRSLAEEVGGFRKGFEGSQDYDLVLRCAERTTPDRIRHIPRVLYHWRALPGSTASAASAKSYAWEAGRMAIAEHLRRLGVSAQVRRALTSYYQVDYGIQTQAPLVSIIVPTTLSSATTAECLGSVLANSSYENFELMLVALPDHVSAARRDAAFAKILTHPHVRVVEYEERPFNFSRVSNLGVRSSNGSILCFLNDDVEVISKNWLERLIARISLDGVAAVGAMLYYPSNAIQHAGVILGVDGLADHPWKQWPRGYAGYFGRGAIEEDFSCVTGACMLVKREIFEAVGCFDESLPVAFNDVDLCIKIRQTGARIVWTPAVEMYHHESLTLGRHDSLARRDQFRRDVRALQARWRDVLAADPCYNPNLSLSAGATFSLAWPPRVPDPMQVIADGITTGVSRTSLLPAKNQPA